MALSTLRPYLSRFVVFVLAAGIGGTEVWAQSPPGVYSGRTANVTSGAGDELQPGGPVTTVPEVGRIQREIRDLNAEHPRRIEQLESLRRLLVATRAGRPAIATVDQLIVDERRAEQTRVEMLARLQGLAQSSSSVVPGVNTEPGVNLPVVPGAATREPGFVVIGGQAVPFPAPIYRAGRPSLAGVDTYYGWGRAAPATDAADIARVHAQSLRAEVERLRGEVANLQRQRNALAAAQPQPPRR